MQSVAADSSVIIAALLAWHDRHEVASASVSRVLSRDRLILPAAALLESYSVMTRLPAGHRLSPEDAWTLLRENFRERAQLTSMPARASWSFLGRLAEAGLGGGLTYEGAILEAAKEAGAKVLLTFNAKDFARLGAGNIEIVVPG